MRHDYIRVMLKTAIVLLALSTVACADDTPCNGEIHLDFNLTPATREATLRAVEKWNAFAGPDTVRVTPGAVCRVRQGKTAGLVPGNGPMFAAYIGDRREIRFDPGSICRDDVDCLTMVAMHEMGHMLGLGHTTGGVMDPFSDGTVIDTFTDVDYTECKNAGVCE